MAEDIIHDPLPDLRELESKVGRKTPESLLMWMKDEGSCGSDVVDADQRGSATSESFSDKISNLKQELRCLRSADVRILRQLVAVHEGIEAFRWLMEERDAVVSRSSSLTGSLSSLVTVEEQGSSMSVCRENRDLTHDLTETTQDDPPDPSAHFDHNESSHMTTLESTEARPPSPSDSMCEVTCVRQNTQLYSSPPNGFAPVNSRKLQTRESNMAPLKDLKSGSDTIKRALLRSSRRKELKANSDIFFVNISDLTRTETQPEPRHKAAEKLKAEDSEGSTEMVLLGYDAQWCWVESQDDVTFL